MLVATFTSCVDYSLSGDRCTVVKVYFNGKECSCTGYFGDDKIEFPCSCEVNIGDTIYLR